jgi:2-phospho-L-lactate/phosphoenolpyruvate guanylyltransferase
LSCWALVPVKARTAGKQRLAQALCEETRTRLIAQMLEHVLATIRQCPDVAGVFVVTPDRGGLAPALRVLPDAGAGLNEALHAALPQLQIEGARAVAIISADLPLLTNADVAALVQAGHAAGIALAPDHTGSGTNALCLTLPTAFRFQFGPGSLARHSAEATRLGSAAALVKRDGLAFDIDEPADIEKLKSRKDPRYDFLR